MPYIYTSADNVTAQTTQGLKITNVAQACPDEGWLDLFVMFPKDPGIDRLAVDRSKGAIPRPVRVYENYDLVQEGAVIRSVRWDYSTRTLQP